MAPAIFIHDTYTIVSVNPAACALFRCEAVALTDIQITGLIASEDFRGLALLRMRILREQGRNIPDVKYPFRRCDGSIFWASVNTRKRDDGHYETIVHYEFEE